MAFPIVAIVIGVGLCVLLLANTIAAFKLGPNGDRAWGSGSGDGGGVGAN